MKQSIYKFRNADLDIFNEKYIGYNSEDNDNTRIDLVFNYRSNKIVLDSINYMFNAIMDKRYGGLEYYHDKYASLNYDFLRKDKCKTDDLVEQANTKLDQEARFDTDIMLMVKTDEDSKELVESEAMMVANKIHSMVGKLDLDFYYGTRKANYQDIVVLSRKVANFITYKKIFQKANIPSLIVLTKGFFESNEIIACVSFLQAVNNALDDVAFVSFLKGNYAFSKKSEEWIYKHKKPKESMYNSLLECEDEDVKEILAIYHEYCDFASNHPVYELLEKFISDSKYDLFVSSLYNGQQRYANIQLFIETLKNDADLSLYQIVEKFNQTMNLGIEYKPATLPNDGNAVVFMTIHQSKGLEFPIVFVNQLDYGFNFEDNKQSLMYNKDKGFIIDAYKTDDLDEYRDVLIKYKNPTRRFFANSITNEIINEEMRILYVALTRASQKLILTGTIDDLKEIVEWQDKIIDYSLETKTPILTDRLRKANNMLEWVILSAMKHPQICKQIKDLECFSKSIRKSLDSKVIRDNMTKISLYTQQLDQPNIRHAKYSLSILNKQDLNLSFDNDNNAFDMNIYKQNSKKVLSSTNTLDKTIAVTRIVDDGNRSFNELDTSENEESVKATDRGTIIHSVMEHLSLDCRNLDDELQHLYANKLYNEEEQALIEGYKEHIQVFISSDVYKIMQDSQHCFKEKEFSFIDDNQQIIHGIFDVVCIDDDMINIIDYKTDRVSKDSSEESLKESHAGQMDYYKQLMKKIFPDKQVQAIVYYLHIDKYVVI